MKKCPICNEEKPKSEFYTYWSKKRETERISNYCKPCAREKSRKRAAEYYEENKQERLEYAKKYREENKDLLRKKKRKYKRKHIKELKPCYVADLASSAIGVPQRIISQDEELVEAYANIIRIKRKIRDAEE